MNIHQRLWFLLCVSIFFSCSCILYRAASDEQAHYERDSYGYVAIAENFAQTFQLTHPNSNTMPVQTVGYPLFVGIIFKLFGLHTLPVILAQIILSILSGLLTMKIALLLFGNLSAYISALLWSLNLGFLVFSQFFMTEILLITLLLTCIYNFFLYMIYNNKKALFLSGLFSGCSVAVKPVALLYVIGLCICILIWKKGYLIKKGQEILLFCLIFLVPVMSYMTFNKITYDTFSISSLVNENLYVYFLSKLNVHIYGISYSSAMKNILANYQGFSRTNAKQWDSAKQQFWHHVYTRPLLVAAIWIGNVCKTFLGLFSTQLKLLMEPTLKGGECSFSNTKGSIFSRFQQYIFGHTTSVVVQNVALIEALWNIVRYLLVALALLFLLLDKQYFLFCFFVGSISYFSSITGHDGCGRYRMMFEPLLVLLASLTLSIIYDKYKGVLLWNKKITS